MKLSANDPLGSQRDEPAINHMSHVRHKHACIAAHCTPFMYRARNASHFTDFTQTFGTLAKQPSRSYMAYLYSTRRLEAWPLLPFTLVSSSFISLVRILPLVTAGFPPPWSLVFVAFWLQSQFLVFLSI
jgi:hypothetical protein